jgi:hypothetical protein
MAVDKTPKVTIELKNSGQTPGRHMTSRIELELLDRDPPESHFTLSAPGISSRSPIAPNGTYSVQMWLDRTLTQTEIDAVKNDEMALYAWGRLDYVDIFDKPRLTMFRAILGKDQIDAGGQGMSVCENGNDIT